MNESEVRAKMQSALDALTQDISSIRTGRANSSIVENIVVPAYGGAQRLKIMELASINASDPSSLVISPWDKQVIGEINKAILAANIGVNPSLDGEVIRINVPPLTGEDREKFVKILHTKLENGRIQIRQIRGDIMKDLKDAFENKDISEDERKQNESNLQKIVEEFNLKIEEVGAKKEKELLQV